MDLSIAEDQTQGSHPTYQAIRKPALWWVTAVLLAGIIAIVLPIQKIRMLGLQLGGTIGSYTTNPPPAPQYAAISPGGSSLTVTWSQVSAATSYSVYRSDLKDSQGHPYAIGSGSSTSSGNYTDTSTTSGKSYTYWVTASNGGGEGPGSPSVSATVNTSTPPAPAHGKLIVSGGSIKAYFSTVSGASSYNAYRDGWLMQTGVTSPYTDGGVPAGTSHWYTFGAVNSNGQGGMGPSYLSGTGGATPPVTTNLAATAGNNSVQLSWNSVTDTNGGSVSYNLYRSSSAGGEGDVPVQNWISSTGSGSVSYTDNDVSAGVTYYYKVAPVSYTGGEGTLSNEASATPLTQLLPAPNLSGAPGDSSASLTWTTVAGASSYNVYRNNEYVAFGSPDNGKVPLVKVDASGTTYTDSGLTSGAWYYYTVNAVSTDGQGLSSQYVTVIPGSISPTLATHIVWTSDYTVTPNVQTSSTSGTVGGNTILHLSLRIPPNFNSAVASSITVQEDSGGTANTIARNVTFNIATSTSYNSQWSALCGDPDPSQPSSPPMAYCDVPWSSSGAHNGNQMITINVQATIGNSFTPITVTSTIHVDREDLLITNTTPANPTMIKWDPSTNQPTTVSASFTCGYKATCTATLAIFGPDGTSVRTYTQTNVPTKSGSLSFTWDGTRLDSAPGSPPIVAPPGIYAFKITMRDSAGVSDSDKSSFLSASTLSGETPLASDDGSTTTYQVSYTISSADGTSGHSGEIDTYDPNLKHVGQPTVLASSDLTPGLHTVLVSYPSTATPGTYQYAVSAEDNDASQDRGHRLCYALQPSAMSATGEMVGSGTNVRALCQVQAKETTILSAEVHASLVGKASHPDQIIWQYGGPPTPLINHWLTIDSTHFQDGDTVLLSIIPVFASLTPGVQIVGTPMRMVVRIYNKAYLLANAPMLNEQGVQKLGYILPFLKANLQPLGHTVDMNMADSAPVILSKLTDNTFFYIFTHGHDTGRFLDCVADNNHPGPTTEANHVVHDSQVQSAINLKVMRGMNLIKPDYNLVWLDGCLSGANNRFPVAFNITGDDHAFVGWAETITGASRRMDYVHFAFSNLSNGMSLELAINYANTLLQAKEAKPSKKPYVPFKPVIFGDRKTKLHGVYGIPMGTQWFR